MARGLHHPAHGIDNLRTGLDRYLPCPNQRQIDLRLGGPRPNRREERRPHVGEAGQQVGVRAIMLRIALRNQAQLPRIRDQHLVATAISLAGLDTVPYVDFPPGGKIDAPTATQIAEEAVRSATRRTDGRDGISYLIEAKASGIITPLMPAYEATILELTGAANLEEARERARVK